MWSNDEMTYYVIRNWFDDIATVNKVQKTKKLMHRKPYWNPLFSEGSGPTLDWGHFWRGPRSTGGLLAPAAPTLFHPGPALWWEGFMEGVLLKNLKIGGRGGGCLTNKNGNGPRKTLLRSFYGNHPLISAHSVFRTRKHQQRHHGCDVKMSLGQ